MSVSYTFHLTCPYPECKLAICLDAKAGDWMRLNYFEEDHYWKARVAWGHCPGCRQLIVIKEEGVSSGALSPELDYPIEPEAKIIHPVPPPRNISATKIPADIRIDFNEAAAVFPASPKASAALSRRILQHVLRTKFNVKRQDLSKEIEEFLKRPGIPEELAKSIDAIRNIGNFAAHPMKDTNTGEIADVEDGEADWLLDLLEMLFDFAYIQPARHQANKDKLNKKLVSLGKQPMK